MDLLSVKEACGRLRCGRSRFYGFVREGRIGVKKIGGRTFVTANSIDGFLAACPDKVSAPPCRKAI